jgi:hypothetical protein
MEVKNSLFQSVTRAMILPEAGISTNKARDTRRTGREYLDFLINPIKNPPRKRKT